MAESGLKLYGHNQDRGTWLLGNLSGPGAFGTSTMEAFINNFW